MAWSKSNVAFSINRYVSGVGSTVNPATGVKLTIPVSGAYDQVPSPATVNVAWIPAVPGLRSTVTKPIIAGLLSLSLSLSNRLTEATAPGLTAGVTSLTAVGGRTLKIAVIIALSVNPVAVSVKIYVIGVGLNTKPGSGSKVTIPLAELYVQTPCPAAVKEV